LSAVKREGNMTRF